MSKYCLKQSQRDYMNNDPFYELCIHENVPANDIEFEHSLYFAGRKIQEIFSVVPVRRIYNRNPSAKVKAFNQFIALFRLLTADEEYRQRMIAKYPKLDFYEMFGLIISRYDFSIDNFPDTWKRLILYRITSDAP